MADTAKMEARVRELEGRRAKGESVPELDALYTKMDNMNRKAYEDASKYPTGEMPNKPVKKAGGGSVGSASSRADGIAQRGKTRGKMV
jgi:uncharacterized coiled-coil protein SlyX